MNPLEKIDSRSIRMRSPRRKTLAMAALRTIISGILLSAPACRSAVLTAEDATLQERIVDSLHRDHLEAIAVVVSQARATLSGNVSSVAERETAQRDAEQVEGVKAVANNVRVGPP